MSCPITAGYTLDPCLESGGGATVLYIGNFADLDKAGTTITAGTIATLAMQATTKVYKYESDIDALASFEETFTSSRANKTIFYEPSISYNIKKLSATNRNLMRLLAKGQTFVIAKTSAGKYLFFGYSNGLYSTTGTTVSGATTGDAEEYTITLTGKEPESAYMIDFATFSSFIA